MTKPRRKPETRFHTFIVEPSPDFEPVNWQQTPDHYRILKYVGPEKFRGSADAWKFLHNHRVLQTGSTDQWAIYLDLDFPMGGSPNGFVQTIVKSSNVAEICNA